MWNRHPPIKRRRYAEQIGLWKANYGTVGKLMVTGCFFTDLEVLVGAYDLMHDEETDTLACEETPPRKARIVADILAEDLRRRINEMEENS